MKRYHTSYLLNRFLLKGHWHISPNLTVTDVLWSQIELKWFTPLCRILTIWVSFGSLNLTKRVYCFCAY